MEPVSAEAIIDVYLDSEDLELFRDRCSFRVRHCGNQPEITIKRRSSQDEGEFKRDEIKIPCSPRELFDLERDGFEKLLKQHFPGRDLRSFRSRLVVKNSRRSFNMRTKQDGKTPPNPSSDFRAKVSFDIFTYVNPKDGRSTGELYELEIEAESHLASTRLPTLGKSIRKLISNFVPSEGSKYERGVKIFHLDQANWKRWIYQWSTGTGFNLTSLILTIVSLLIGIIGIFLTVISLL